MDNCFPPSSIDEYIVYPNPAQTELNIEFVGTRLLNANFSIFNAFGQKIQLPVTYQSSKTIQFDLSSLSMGHYILLIQNNDVMYTYKFVKQ